MRGIIQLIRRAGVEEDESDWIDSEELPPAPVVSTVGRVVRNVSAALDGYGEQITALRDDIARKQEAQRQAEAALISMQAALSAIAADPALTEAERDMAEAAIMNAATMMIDVTSVAVHN